MRLLLYPMLGLSLLGLGASFIVHLLSIGGVELPSIVMTLHAGIFVVWLPAVLAAHINQPPRHNWFGWRDYLRGSPVWARLAAYGLLAYAFVNFLWAFSGNDPFLRGFSGHWMAFYGFAAATYYAATRRRGPRYCLAGHVVSDTARFCEKCGLSVAES